MAMPFAQNPPPIYVTAPGFPPLPSVIHRLSLSAVILITIIILPIFFLYTMHIENELEVCSNSSQFNSLNILLKKKPPAFPAA
jgi:hypothetical protein